MPVTCQKFNIARASKQAFDFFHFFVAVMIVLNNWHDRNARKLEKKKKHTLNLKNPLIFKPKTFDSI